MSCSSYKQHHKYYKYFCHCLKSQCYTSQPKAIFHLTRIVAFGFSSRNIWESSEKKTHFIPWINSLCLTNYKLKQTLNISNKESATQKSQTFLLLLPHSLKGHFCAPPSNDYLVMITEVCGLKSNMISKLIKHRKKRDPDQSPRKLTACLIQALSAWNSLSQACLVMLSFWDTASIKKGLKNWIKI